MFKWLNAVENKLPYTAIEKIKSTNKFVYNHKTHVLGDAANQYTNPYSEAIDFTDIKDIYLVASDFWPTYNASGKELASCFLTFEINDKENTFTFKFRLAKKVNSKFYWSTKAFKVTVPYVANPAEKATENNTSEAEK
ncbi:hypothetical protein [Mycoplasma seminis]|uniref:Uncharacterized protein n=1 Tax=Mycoplasma seminis TaxID=512749 RepID=A0ABY9HAQ2_9MOLU|nr:hypothetical protein [Mycoplasma seminis]WLP85260.1 hypothetical protein Q8852_02975 [Mycoplasma seminis]